MSDPAPVSSALPDLDELDPLVDDSRLDAALEALLLVVDAPGHTPGHVAFLDTRDGTLVAGDAFQTRGGIAVSGMVRPTFPFPALATWHKPTALASARALRELNPMRLAVGHGVVLADPRPAMDGAIAVAESHMGRQAAHAG